MKPTNRIKQKSIELFYEFIKFKEETLGLIVQGFTTERLWVRIPTVKTSHLDQSMDKQSWEV